MTCIPWQNRMAATWLALCLATPLQAGIHVSLGSIEAEAWRADAVELELSDGPQQGYRLVGQIAGLTLPGQSGEWRQVRLTCEELRLEKGEYDCPRLQLQAQTPYGDQRLEGALRYRDSTHWSFTLKGLQLAGGQWHVSGESSGDWYMALRGQGIAPPGLMALFGPEGLPAWDWQGRIGVQARLAGSGSQPAKLSLEARLDDVAWSSADGLQAGQRLSGTARLQGQWVDQTWRFQLNSEWRSGQVYSDPMFVELSQHPLRLTGRLRWAGGDEPMLMDALQLRLGELLQLAAQGRLPMADPLQGTLRVQAEVPDLAAAYPVLLQPFGYGRVFGELDVSGDATAQLHWERGTPVSAEIHLAGIHLDDRQGRFGIADMTTDLYWQSTGVPLPSRLQWHGGNLYRIAFGASSAELLLGPDQISLARPLVLPLLEGKLRIPELQASGLLQGQPAWRAALRAETLSLPALTAALGWPALAGELSVQIPTVRYAEGVLEMDGELVAQAFDGEVTVTDLQLRDPAGPAPVFEAQASLRRLDLERLTRVFDFGRITGRLDGDVRGLQLVGWEPTGFQAELRNPEDDDLPHKISQRAVENLTALGNNGAMALSGTFLRFFESFSYDRMLLKVRLDGQRAELDGIPHPSGGYYLVKGAGLPRIDVIGRNREVAWRDLVERLRRIRLQGAQVR
jgi:hypothetical protein